ncbi:MAG: plasmid mobilization relaxosome protein MobC [Crocosphaera sp.]|nr:plasmid mobilization relaxosome protein MobC [Crocosphaera sp.]
MTTDKRDTNLTIRVSQAEKLAWKEKADLSGMTISNLIRQAIFRTKTWTVADKSLVKEQTRQIARIGNNLNQIARWANTYKSTAEAVEIIQALRLIEQALTQLSTKSNQSPSSNHSENSNDVS